MQTIRTRRSTRPCVVQRDAPQYSDGRDRRKSSVNHAVANRSYLRRASLLWSLRRARAAQAAPSTFVPSAQCIACHAQLTAPSGDDISIGFDWRATMMANSARDPYWHAAVRREVLDHPAAQAAIEDKCATCHMPMARFDAAAAGGRGEVFANLAADGAAARARGGRRVVHRLPPDLRRRLGRARELRRRLPIEPAGDARVAFGPHDVDPGRQSVMRSAASFTPSVGTAHSAVRALRDVPHAVHDGARRRGAGRSVSCRSRCRIKSGCTASTARRIAVRVATCRRSPATRRSLPCSAQPRPRVSQHTFLGSNAFMLGMLRQVSRRARRHRAAAGARGRGRRDAAVPRDACRDAERLRPRGARATGSS